MNKKITKATIFYFIGNVFNKAIVLLTLPIFTRIMPTEDFGIVNTYLAWVAIGQLLIGLSLGNSIRTAYNDYKNDFPRYISSILMFSLICFFIELLIIIGIIFFSFDRETFFLIIMGTIQAYMMSVCDVVSMKYMMEFEYKKRTFILSIPNIVIVVVSIFLIINMENNKYYGRIISYVIVYSLLGSVLLLNNLAYGKFKMDMQMCKYAVTYSVPLVVHGLSMTILNQSDRIMLTSISGASETAIYSAVYSMSLALQVITSACEGVWIPWFNSKMKNNQLDQVNGIARKYIMLMSCMATCIMFVLPEVFKLMTDMQYWDGIPLIAPIVMASYFVFLYSLLVNYEYLNKMTKNIAINTLFSAIINILLNFLLIPQNGMYGAAYATLLAYICSFILHFVCVRKKNRRIFPFKLFAFPVFVVFVSVLIFNYLKDISLFRWGIALIIGGMVMCWILKQKSFISEEK